MKEPIGILYEHPEWFQPLFAALDRRGLAYARIPAQAHRYDPAARSAPYSLVVNRVSPSSYLRDHSRAVFYAQQYLAHLEEIGVPVVNGLRAYRLELSKARQLQLLARLGLPHPRSRVVNAVVEIAPAAAELVYPIIVKPNIGGSGALMRRFDTPGELAAAVADGALDSPLGLDYTAIVQEYHPPRHDSIVRVEALDDRLLYAIRIYNDTQDSFNLCPADICQLPPPGQRGVKKPLRVEAADPPAWVIEAVLQIFRASSIDIGGVEYLESARDGGLYLYDINALSNFVTDAPRIVGFDPFEYFVDYLARRAGLAVGALAP
jgi:hypothetical protein